MTESVSTGEGKIDKDGPIIFISKSYILLYDLYRSLIKTEQTEKNVLNQGSEDPLNWSESETKLAVLSVIIKKSRKLNQTIAAASIRQIQSGLKKYYNKDLTKRQILNVIRSLGRIVMKEKDPRNRRRTLYRINPNSVEEATITLVKLNNKKAHKNNYFEGTLCYPLLSTEKKKFLAIGHKH